MNFNPPYPPAEDSTTLDPPAVQVGNVYRSKGGKDTAYWVIVGLKGHYAHAIGIDKEGEIMSTTSYGVHAFERRPLVGKCENLRDLTLDVVWSIEP